MNGLTGTDAAIILLGGAIIFAGLLWKLVEWIKEAPVQPDPWDAETERQLHEPDAMPVCHHCFTPCPPRGWFCENCGCAVGPYNNLMPYISIFSEGEVLRNGVNQRVRSNFLTMAGYFLVSLDLLILAPVYWIRLASNLLRVRNEKEDDTGEVEKG